MKHVIFTSSDSKYGDFLINHWLPSLKDNVNLNKIDIVILDYGLTKEQISKLKGVKIYKGVRNGHVCAIRFRGMLKFLEKNKYDQVLSIDGGDIIFQDDLKQAFENYKNHFRVVCEDFHFPFEDFFVKNFFKKTDIKKIKKTLKNKKQINAGVIFGPYSKFKKLCKEINTLLINKNNFGPDQVAVNYILYKDGFKNLDKKYNFVIIATNIKNKFFIEKGVFYLENGEKIAIVHNAGNKPYFRPIKNFGYGPSYNKIKKPTYFIVRNFIRMIHFFKKKRS
ncbi:glycosyl transferase family 8 [Candidatus Woesearchaeota archaeon]|nr:glycosyl transferase family 8 [Candidatus Woesearchaeota archaeon]